MSQINFDFQTVVRKPWEPHPTTWQIFRHFSQNAVLSVATFYAFGREFSRNTSDQPPISFRPVDLYRTRIMIGAWPPLPKSRIDTITDCENSLKLHKTIGREPSVHARQRSQSESEKIRCRWPNCARLFAMIGLAKFPIGAICCHRYVHPSRLFKSSTGTGIRAGTRA
jgi:hypothetical protein